MGRFYFHLQADDQIVPDDEGVDLPDLSAAEHEAILALQLPFFEMGALSDRLVCSAPV
jgi:hypothetical protein